MKIRLLLRNHAPILIIFGGCALITALSWGLGHLISPNGNPAAPTVAAVQNQTTPVPHSAPLNPYTNTGMKVALLFGAAIVVLVLIVKFLAGRKKTRKKRIEGLPTPVTIWGKIMAFIGRTTGGVEWEKMKIFFRHSGVALVVTGLALTCIYWYGDVNNIPTESMLTVKMGYFALIIFAFGIAVAAAPKWVKVMALVVIYSFTSLGILELKRVDRPNAVTRAQAPVIPPTERLWLMTMQRVSEETFRPYGFDDKETRRVAVTRWENNGRFIQIKRTTLNRLGAPVTTTFEWDRDISPNCGRWYETSTGRSGRWEMHPVAAGKFNGSVFYWDGTQEREISMSLVATQERL